MRDLDALLIIAIRNNHLVPQVPTFKPWSGKRCPDNEDDSQEEIRRMYGTFE